jgi:hypothetical protein
MLRVPAFASTLRTCVNPACGRKFRPMHSGHIWCGEACNYSVLKSEIGISAAGMRPLGFMGDASLIHAFNRKWKRIARASRAPLDATAKETKP